MDKRIPKGMHRMPDGTLMKDSEHADYEMTASRGSNYVKHLLYKDAFDMNKIDPKYRKNLSLTVPPKKEEKITRRVLKKADNKNNFITPSVAIAEDMIQERKDRENPNTRLGKREVELNKVREQGWIDTVDGYLTNLKKGGYYEWAFKKLTPKEKKDLRLVLDILLGYKNSKKGYVYEALKDKIDAFEIPSYITQRFYKPKERLQSHENGGVVEQAKELYEVAQNFPDEFDRAYNLFKGEMGKIYDFWADLLGFRRGGRVTGGKRKIGF
jgi:hypothetical protein